MNIHHLSARLTALLLAAALGCTALTACGKKDNTSSNTEETTAKVEQKQDSEPETEAETEPETEASTAHISPIETVTSSLGAQIDVDAILNRDSDNDEDKNYKASLSGLIEEGDIVDSFTFVFYAADGTSNIGTYKGGCGISVTEDCTAATDDGWYQSEDFSVQANGSYVEVKWDVPSEIRSYIAAEGSVQIGYWWGDTATVNLKNIICTYTRTAELPVDSTQTISVGETLNFNSDDTNSVIVPLGDILGEDGVPQAITFDISAGSSFGKFTGAFGITTNDWYQTDTIAVPTNSGNLSLTWIIPETIKRRIPQNADVMLGYWWGETTEATLQSITVKYSYGLGTGEIYTPEEHPDEEIDADGAPIIQTKSGAQAQAIVDDIKVGWCLGNTLDCYDEKDKAKDLETYWGNVKTTKAMIDAVKAKGFNAVRIPVSWANHLDENNKIDGTWMDRVQEVVDYAVDNDLYVILNMHHDDYMWLHPVYAEETEVTEKYADIWKQIAERFSNYDHKLLFEGLNEPRIIGTSYEWTGGNAEERDVINHLLQKFVDTVRASGGKNAERTLIVTTHAASITDAALNGLVVPNDDNLIVSIHNYAPWKLTTAEYPEVTEFGTEDMAELDKAFDKLCEKFDGVPVIIGEFGAEDKDNTAERAELYAYYVSAAAKRGIPCFVWDNGLEDGYGLLDRSQNDWYYEEIVDAMMDQLK